MVSKAKVTSEGDSELATGVPIAEPTKGATTKGLRQGRMLRDAFIVSVVLISAYLLNGRYAHAVCNLFTAVPASLFSYAQLSDHTTHMFAYKATIFYWTISGVLLASDNVFFDSFGYFFGKFLLLTALFLNAVHQHQVSRRINERQQRGARIAASTASLLTALTLTDATQFSTKAPYTVKRVIPARSVSTALLNSAPGLEMAASSDTAFTDTASLYSLGATSAGDEGGIDTKSSDDIHKAGDQASLVKRTTPETMALIIDGDGNVSVEPTKSVIFKAPFIEPSTINITNNCDSSLMWALRTNAVERLVAQPTSGVIHARANAEFKIGLVEAPPTEQSVTDRLGIDYSFVDDSVAVFDRTVLQAAGNERKRVKIDVRYEY
ncbi:hypothetical protein Tcan_15019 [Toxocara canis]|uniref:Major sperm protein n=1 Tax=Toxocara canis TaxID=6265 RepID=A0A0B2USH1_TOXCA|nr:hypothetical protein Tcan_15019 [Toxocara canis]